MRIFIEVPNGDKCTYCDFLVMNKFENIIEKHCCIFKTKIENDKKCVGCKNCMCNTQSY